MITIKITKILPSGAVISLVVYDNEQWHFAPFPSLETAEEWARNEGAELSYSDVVTEQLQAAAGGAG
jgi:hypothetical protein